MLQAGIDAGEFRDVDPWLTARAWLGMHNYTYLWLKPGGRVSARDVAKPFADIFLRGIGQAPKQASTRDAVLRRATRRLEAEEAAEGAADHGGLLVGGNILEQPVDRAPGCRGTCLRRAGSRCPTRCSTRR